MSNVIQRTLATGNRKIYYNVDKEFVATGTFFTNSNVYYSAAHPSRGLWLCAITGDNSPIDIGFIRWENISRIVVDRKNENVFVIPYKYDEIIDNADFSFRKVYKGAFTHTMAGTGEKAIVLGQDLFSGNILPYLQSRCRMDFMEENMPTSIWSILYVVIFILVFGSVIVGMFF